MEQGHSGTVVTEQPPLTIPRVRNPSFCSTDKLSVPLYVQAVTFMMMQQFTFIIVEFSPYQKCHLLPTVGNLVPKSLPTRLEPQFLKALSTLNLFNTVFTSNLYQILYEIIDFHMLVSAKGFEVRHLSLRTKSLPLNRPAILQPNFVQFCLNEASNFLKDFLPISINLNFPEMLLFVFVSVQMF